MVNIEDEEYNISVSQTVFSEIVEISKSYYSDGNFNKALVLTHWNGIHFDGYDFRNYEDFIVFPFCYQDELYFALDKLLSNDDEIIIKDEHAIGESKKYMVIKREEDLINIILYNKNDCCIRNFDVFVTLGEHENSEIKKRLLLFIEEARNILNEEYHQYSIEEYLLVKSIQNKKR